MAIFVLSNGDPEISIPAGGTTIHKVYGTSGVDKLNLLQGTNVILDPSFNAGIDLIRIQGNSNTFMISNSGATVTFTDSSGDIIKIPAGTVGQTLIFDDGSAKLQILNGILMLGNQIITSTNTTINAIGNTNNATFNVSSNASQVTEGSNATFTVNLSSAQSTTTTVNYTLSGTGGAVIGTDTGYVSPSGNSGTLTFAAGETAKTITVPITFDSVTETGEGLMVSLSNPSTGTTIGTASSASTSITDSLIDTTPPVLVSSTPADNSTGVAIANNITLGFSENVVIADASGIKLYDTTGNYVAANVSIINGNNLVIDPIANLAGNTGYYVQVSATAVKDAAGNSFAGIANTTTLNFATVSAAPTYSLTAASANVNEGTNAIFNLVTTNVAGGTVLNYTLSGSGITASDIIGGSLTGSVTVGSDGKGTIAVPISSDLTTEGIEILSANLNNGLAAANTTVNDTSKGATTSTYAIAPGSSSYGEGGIAAFNIFTTNVTAGTVLPYTLSGTGINAADITGGSLTGSVTISSDGKATINIPLAADMTTEGNETLTVTLGASLATANIIINDTSIAQMNNATFSVSAAQSVTEGNNATFTVNLSSAQSTTTTVNYTLSGTGGAVIGTDTGYVSPSGNSGTLTFAAGETAKTITVPITFDSVTETGEWLIVSLSNPSNGTTIGTASNASTSITDGNFSPVAVDDALSTNGTGAMTITFAQLTGNDTIVTGGTATITGATNATGGTIGNIDFAAKTITFTPSAIGTAGFDYTLSDGKGGTDTGHATITVSAATVTPGTLSYSATTLAEAAANNGTVTSTTTVTLSGDTFVAAPTATFTGIPSGLTGVFTRVSDTTGIISLTGSAAAHTNANDTNFTVAFDAADFTKGVVATNPSQAIAIDFADQSYNTYTTWSIDSGTVSTPANINASSGSFNFTDNASILNNVIISGFSSNDKITVSNNTYYDFTSNGSDVGIEYNNNGILNKIVLTGVISNGALVYDEASFEAAIGFNAISYA